MVSRRAGVVLGAVGLLVVSVVYCLPGHPSAHRGWLDALSHVGLFGLIGALAWLMVRRAWMLVVVALLGVALEVIQWRLGGYPHVELADILANEAGVALAGLVLALRGSRA